MREVDPPMTLAALDRAVDAVVVLEAEVHGLPADQAFEKSLEGITGP